ncbi:hypothetical protein A0H81_01956 [Grifola frondosa]|uniref:Uncharacterized protein n=1 Tax=Grifola frondosa TaxID=5627 RepID=A0A1C7MR52_GRIFR|nr:hypothetical protein A0H81_01956 [Grifola frondosa]
MVGCLGCSEKFKTTKALRVHSKTCKGSRNFTSNTFKLHRKRQADADNSRAAKLRRTDEDDDINDAIEVHNECLDVEPELDIQQDVPVDPATVSRAGCRRIFPKALQDFLPTSVGGLAAHINRPARPRPRRGHFIAPDAAEDPHSTHVPTPHVSPPPEEANAPEDPPMHFDTKPNSFGLYKCYTRQPPLDPDARIDLVQLCDAPTLTSSHISSTRRAPLQSRTNPGSTASTSESEHPPFAPFENITTFRMMNWQYNDLNTKSQANLMSIIDIMQEPDFDPAHLRNFSVTCELARLDAYGKTCSPFSADDGWLDGSVQIRLPKEGHSYLNEAAAPLVTVRGIHYRPLLEVICAAFQHPSACGYHFVPHHLFWQPNSETGCDSPIRIYSEVYNSNAMIEEDAEIQALPREPGDDPALEYAVAPVMLWSDSTHLASFGTASLWPIYVYFGNLSKYTRGKPTSFAAEHLAYIPVVCRFAYFIITHLLKASPSYQMNFKIFTLNYMATARRRHFGHSASVN